MTNFQIHIYDENKIRTLKDEWDETWFVGKDVAGVLGYVDLNKAVQMHVDSEDKKLNDKSSLSFGQRGATLINESGLYSLIISSKLPTAKKFKRWVTSEVLPSIRNQGAYLTPEKIEEVLTDPDTIIKIATQLKEERAMRMQAEKAAIESDKIIQLQKPKVLFADAVDTSSTSILVGQLAKLLRQNGVAIGQNRLFAWFRDNGYLCKKGENYNEPSQYSLERGWFELKERTIQSPDGEIKITRTSKVTGKGQLYFVQKFIKTLKGEDLNDA